MENASYQQRRSQLEEYFDRTAADAWARITSDGPVSRIRATVRAGRDRMRTTLLSYLPDDLRGAGGLAVEPAPRVDADPGRLAALEHALLSGTSGDVWARRFELENPGR